MQVPVFLSLFLAPVYVPLGLMSGWIHGVASVNPVTAVLTTGRDLIAGDPAAVGTAVAIVVGLIAVFSVWAARSLRSAEAAGG